MQGKPRPTVSWSRDGEPLKPTEVSLRNSDTDTILFIRMAERTHSGKYDLQVQIENVVDTASIHIQIVGEDYWGRRVSNLVTKNLVLKLEVINVLFNRLHFCFGQISQDPLKTLRLRTCGVLTLQLNGRHRRTMETVILLVTLFGRPTRRPWYEVSRVTLSRHTLKSIFRSFLKTNTKTRHLLPALRQPDMSVILDVFFENIKRSYQWPP